MAAVRRKLVAVGDGACGASLNHPLHIRELYFNSALTFPGITSLLNVFIRGEFQPIFMPTILENYVAEVRVDGREVELAIWDTAGQEEYERLRPLVYPGSHVILICYSIDCPDSLENVPIKVSIVQMMRLLKLPNLTLFI